MTQKLNVKNFALASALVGGIVYFVCALLYWINSEFLIRVGNYLIHGIDLTKIMRTDLTLSSTMIGLILTLILVYLIGSLFAKIYNHLIK